MRPDQLAIRRLQQLFIRAQRSRLREPTAVTLATADAQGRPSARTVLVKGIDARGVVFYTNLHSRKAQELAANPRAALCVYWEPLDTQVSIEGHVEPVTHEEAEAYWKTRPRESQVGAWASHQSAPLRSQAVLLTRVAKYAAQFMGRPVPRPAHWSGFRIIPDRMEFWTRRAHRLHHREVYRKVGRQWIQRLLYP